MWQLPITGGPQDTNNIQMIFKAENTMGSLRRSALFFLATLLSTTLLASCDNDTGTPAAASATSPLATLEVRLAKVRELTAVNQTAVVGTVQASERAEISAKITASIDSLPVSLGSRIAAGQLLVSLKAGEIEARLAQAKAQLLQAKRNLAREEKLLQKNAATKEDVKLLREALAIAEAAHQEAKTMLNYTAITAPFDGIVTDKIANAGDLATPGKPLLRLESLARLEIVTAIPEAFVSQLQLGDVLAATIAAVDIDLKAEVVEMSPVSDPASRTSRVKLALPRQQGIRSGQFARVFLSEKSQTTLAVPAEAVTPLGQMERVFVAADNSAELRLVRTGTAFFHEGVAHVEILSGLKAGEEVILVETRPPVHGQPIQPIAL